MRPLRKGWHHHGPSRPMFEATAPGQLSANYEIKVQFTEPKPWIAHFAPDELSAA